MEIDSQSSPCVCYCGTEMKKMIRLMIRSLRLTCVDGNEKLTHQALLILSIKQQPTDPGSLCHRRSDPLSHAVDVILLSVVYLSVSIE